MVENAGPANITISVFVTRKGTAKARATCTGRDGKPLEALSHSCFNRATAAIQAMSNLIDKWNDTKEE